MSNKNDVKKRQEAEDKIVNRILINFGIGILGYVFLGILWKMNIPWSIAASAAVVFAVFAVVCFVACKIKSKAFLPYGVMFVCFALASLFIKSSYVVSKLIGMERFVALMETSRAAKIMLNASNDIKAVAIGGGVYLAVMLIVNIVMLTKLKND